MSKVQDSSSRYHREEIAIALTPTDGRRVQPTLPATFRTILDVGCGAGQTLLGCALGPDVKAYGVDVDSEALVLGREVAPHVRFANAEGERLPFCADVFDVVISRVALPYMHMPTALKEVARVMKSGGFLWLALHPASMFRRRLQRSLRKGDLRDVVYSLYILANGLLFHYTGRQLRFPLNQRRCESFQTIEGITRSLDRCGLKVVEASYDPFVVSALKAQSHATAGRQRGVQRQ